MLTKFDAWPYIVLEKPHVHRDVTGQGQGADVQLFYCQDSPMLTNVNKWAYCLQELAMVTKADVPGFCYYLEDFYYHKGGRVRDEVGRASGKDWLWC